MQGFEISYLSSGDLNDIMKILIESYFTREPIIQALEARPEDLKDFFKEKTYNYIIEGNSIGVRDEMTNQLVGVMLNSFHANKQPSYQKTEVDMNNKLKQFLHIENTMDQSYNVWENGQVFKVLEMVNLVVHQDYCRRGIAKKLVQLSEELAYKLDCQQVITQASNVVSQGLFCHMGFKTVATVSWDSFKMEGENILGYGDKQDKSKYLYMIKDINQNNKNNNRNLIF